MDKNPKVPSSVMFHGKQNPVSVDKRGKISIKETDPLAPIKQSPFKELLPATEDWVKEYGGSDVSIVAYNVSVLLKGQENANKSDEDKADESKADESKAD